MRAVVTTVMEVAGMISAAVAIGAWAGSIAVTFALVAPVLFVVGVLEGRK